MREKKTRIRRKNMGYKKLFLMLIIIFIIGIIFVKVIVPGTISISGYVYKSFRSLYLSMKNFYFTSNRLEKNIDDAHYETSNWSGVSDYNIEVKMYSKKNTLEKVASDMDIAYKLNFDVGVFRHGFDENGKAKYEELEYFENATEETESDYLALDIEKTEGIIYGASGNEDSFDIKIIPKSSADFKENDYVYVKITAEATEPYKETLYGEFYIYVGKEKFEYQIDDAVNESYMKLILTNATEEYTVDVAFNEYAVGDVINAGIYRELVRNNPEVEDYCHSKYVNLSFDPNVVILDTTSDTYIDAEEMNNANPSSGWLGSQFVEQDGTQYEYVSQLKVEVDALESKVVKFYKLDVTKDYTYPNKDDNSIITVEEI